MLPCCRRGFLLFLAFCFVFDGSLSAAACRRDGLEGAGPPPAPPGAGASSRLATQCRVRRMRRAITVMMRSGRCCRRGSSRLSPSPRAAAMAEAAPYWERSGTTPRGPPGLRGSGALGRCSAGCGAVAAWPGGHPGPLNGAEGLRPCRPGLAAESLSPSPRCPGHRFPLLPASPGRPPHRGSSVCLGLAGGPGSCASVEVPLGQRRLQAPQGSGSSMTRCCWYYYCYYLLLLSDERKKPQHIGSWVSQRAPHTPCFASPLA